MPRASADRSLQKKMSTHDSFADGLIYSEVTKGELASMFDSAGYPATIGQWAVRLDSPMRFKIAYVGNITPMEPYEIEGDGYGVDLTDATTCCAKIAEVLTANGIQFEFTHMNPEGEEIAVYENTKPSEQAAAPKP